MILIQLMHVGERVELKDINDIMPKIRGMRWGALTNTFPTNAKIKQMDKMFPRNGKWHTVFEEKDQVHIDGKTIRRKSRESMT